LSIFNKHNQCLRFENWHNLLTIHDSIGYLDKLEILNAKLGCYKLESFPPLRLTSLEKLKLSKCKSLKSFPELLVNMTNIEEILLSEIFIGEFPFSFQNLSELRILNILRCVKLRPSSNISMMQKLSHIHVQHCDGLLLPKHNNKLSFTVSSNVNRLSLERSNLSDECLPIILKWFANVKYLNLSDNNFKILPKCLDECHLISRLVLNGCKSLEEIRGIPPNLIYFSAIKCESLTSQCRRMLLSQVCCFFLH
jgi:Leucine-rich repeat (LRR) protein